MKPPLVLRAALALCPLLAARGQMAQPDPVGNRADEPVKLPDFEVSSTRDVGYGARDATGATRMNIPLDQTPTTVVVLDQEFLKDLAASEANVALAFVSGMNPASTQYTGQFAIRGFNQAGVTYRDGLPQNTSISGSQFLEMASIERMEVIKGPEGVLYGSEASGGVVNAVTKTPLANRRTDVTFTASSWDTFKGTLDTTGPIDSNRRFLYRLILDDQDGNTQIREAVNSFQYINPEFKVLIGKSSSLTEYFSYGHYKRDNSTAAWFASGGQLTTFLDVRQNFDNVDAYSEHWEYLTSTTFEHRFGDNWRTRVVYRENQTDEHKPGYAHGGFTFVNAAGQTVGSASSTFNLATPGWTDILSVRSRKVDTYYEYDYGLYADLAGTFHLGPAKNTLLFSVGYEDTINNSSEWSGTMPSTSVFNPVYYTNPLTVEGKQTLALASETSNPDPYIGVVDNIGFFRDKLIFSLGERRDAVDSYTFNRLTNKATVLKTSGPKGASSKAGVVYRVIPGLAFFGDYADSFTPIAGSTYQGTPNLPETGATKEAGLKLDLWNGRFTGTLSYFNTKQNHVPETVVVDSMGTLGSEQEGFIRVRGTEMDLAGKPIPELTVLFAFGHLNSITDKGLPQRNVPVGSNFKTLAKYTFARGGFLHGVALGAGYIHNCKRAGDTAGSFWLPAYDSYNAFAIYQTGRWRFQLNCENLANSKLAGASSVSNLYVYPARPRNYISSVEYRF